MSSKRNPTRAARFMDYKRQYLAIPYGLFLALFVIVPLLLIVFYAFTDSNGSFGFDAAVHFFTSWPRVEVLIVSIFMGVQNTIFCLLLGYPAAYFLANKKYNKNAVLVMLFVMPMWINFVIRTGATRDLLSWMGLNGGDHPWAATMIGMVYNYLPFTILPLYTTMLKLDQSQVEAAMDLGANPAQQFTKSILPQSLPGVVSAAEMVFMPTMSSYVISDTLSEGKITLFGNSIYFNFSNSQWNEGSFMALIMLALVGLGMLVTKNVQHADNGRMGL